MGTAELRAFASDMNVRYLEIVGRSQGPRPAPHRVRGAQNRKDVPRQNDQLPDKTLLLMVGQAAVAPTLKKPVPPPSPSEKPLHCLLLGIRENGRVDDVSTEAEKNVLLLPVSEPYVDPLVRLAISRQCFNAQTAQFRKATCPQESLSILQNEKRIPRAVNAPEQVPACRRVDPTRADQGVRCRRGDAVPGIRISHYPRPRRRPRPRSAPDTKLCSLRTQPCPPPEGSTESSCSKLLRGSPRVDRPPPCL